MCGRFAGESPLGQNRPLLQGRPGRWILCGSQQEGITSTMNGEPFTMTASSSMLSSGGNEQRTDGVGTPEPIGEIAGLSGDSLKFYSNAVAIPKGNHAEKRRARAFRPIGPAAGLDHSFSLGLTCAVPVSWTPGQLRWWKDQPVGATKCNPPFPIAGPKCRLAVDRRGADGAPTRVGRTSAGERVGGTGQSSGRVSLEVLLNLGGRRSRTKCGSLPMTQPVRTGDTGRVTCGDLRSQDILIVELQPPCTP